MSKITKESNKKQSVKDRKIFMIGNLSLWKLFAYFIVYSIAGFIIETLFCLIVTGGYLESRQSFLYGPFCAIYGLGACAMIIVLQLFKKNNYTLFLGGILVGSVTEYLVSLIGEWLFNTKWWDYTGFPLNINGRICLLYSVFWGILALFLLKYVNPLIDKFFDFLKQKFNIHLLKSLILVVIIFMAIDYIISSFATRAFLVRTIVNKNIEVTNSAKIKNEYTLLYSTEYVSNFIYKYFGDEKMLLIFPRIKVETIDKKIIEVKDFYPDIKTYYFKF